MSSVPISKAYISKLSKMVEEDPKISCSRTLVDKGDAHGCGRFLLQDFKISVEWDVEAVRVLVERKTR